MENKQKRALEFMQSPLGMFFFGIFPIGLGVLDIMISLNVITYRDPRPERIAIFNDPHSWEVFALGAMLLFFGVANILPPRMKALGRLNNYLLLLSFIAVVIGVILNKIR